VVRITSVMLLTMQCQRSMCIKVFITSYAQAHQMVNEVTYFYYVKNSIHKQCLYCSNSTISKN